MVGFANFAKRKIGETLQFPVALQFRHADTVYCMGLRRGDLLQLTSAGLYCADGDFYIDPWKPVPRAVITHAHSDHARPGMGNYWCSRSCAPLLHLRVGADAVIHSHDFAEPFPLGKIVVSFHPAGHIFGSAQIRMERDGEVWVVTGDHNATFTHPVAEPFEPVRCNVLITESTFGLPIYRWPDPDQVIAEIREWWSQNQSMGRTCILPCYPLGKSQRILQALDSALGPIAIHGGAIPLLAAYQSAGINFPDTIPLCAENAAEVKGSGLVILSNGANEPAWLRKLSPAVYGCASGWMQVRGRRRQDSIDRAFILSDHSDWDGLLTVVRASGASRVGVTHGQTATFARYLREVEGIDSFIVPNFPIP